MSLLHVRTVPDPVLERKALKVTSFDKTLRTLAYDMYETMEAYGGVGLAANQVGVLQKVVVIQVPDADEPLFLVNAEVMKNDGEREVEEGCLSLPNYRGLVKRSVNVRVRAQDLSGKEFRVKAEGLLAQALEHEIDHTNGILYVARLVRPDAIWKLPDVEPGEEEQPAEEGETAGEATGT